tara:strand:+ start:527 stop:715 length:189 start_codon:yes stop_codon:yes gene_type:complete
MEDEFLTKKSIIDELKRENLDELSINELQDRIICLKEEIDRAKKKVEVKKLSKNNAENIFKK